MSTFTIFGEDCTTSLVPTATNDVERLPVMFSRRFDNKSFLFLPVGSIAQVVVKLARLPEQEFNLEFENIPDQSLKPRRYTDHRQIIPGAEEAGYQLVTKFTGEVRGASIRLMFDTQLDTWAKAAAIFLTRGDIVFGRNQNAPYITKDEYYHMMQSSFASSIIPAGQIPTYHGIHPSRGY